MGRMRPANCVGRLLHYSQGRCAVHFSSVHSGIWSALNLLYDAGRNSKTNWANPNGCHLSMRPTFCMSPSVARLDLEVTYSASELAMLLQSSIGRDAAVTNETACGILAAAEASNHPWRAAL